VLIMGTATHDADLAVILPALKRLHEELGGRVRFDVIGMTASAAMPPWLRRLHPSAVASQSYPGFIDWITNQPGWDVGIAPLANTAFNRSKSGIKTLDYAALGLAVLGSDVPTYHGSLADAEQGDGKRAGGMLVPATTAAWVEAVGMMLRNPRLRRDLAAGAMERLVSDYTLGAQAESRRALWRAVGAERTQAAPKRRLARAAS
jgi:glycosyltransferase involved in cell wall biosynthesis